jgi:hypothetical protein
MSSAKHQRPSSSSSSSSSRATSIDASLLECSICTHPFDVTAHLPRLLPSCGHTFCAACLASWVSLVDVALSPDETELLVVDCGNDRIQVCRARDGQYLRGWGSRGSAEGRFYVPQSVVVTGSGEMVVADTHNHRVIFFYLDPGRHVRSVARSARKASDRGSLRSRLCWLYRPRRASYVLFKLTHVCSRFADYHDIYRCKLIKN